MSTIFSDDFESGDFSNWTGTSGGSGTTRSVTSAAAHHGDDGCRCSVNGLAPPYANSRVWKSLGTSYSEFYVRFNFRITSAEDWARTIDIALFGAYWSHPHIVCGTSGDQFRLQMYTHPNTGGGTATSWGPLFDLNQTVCIEGYWRKATGPGSADGILRLWQDGELAAERTDVENDAKPDSTEFELWMYNVLTPFEATVDYDDVVVATERITPLRGFRVYHNAGEGRIDYDTVRETRSEYADAWTSSALSYPATWRFGVRAYNENGEEKNINVADELVLLSSGAESPERPNKPTGLKATPAAGGKVDVTFDYNTTDEAASCTHFHIYHNGGAGEVDYTSEVGSVNIDDGIFTHYLFETGALNDGIPYRFAVRAATASDVEDTGIEWVEAIADASAPDQPASLTGEVVR